MGINRFFLDLFGAKRRPPWSWGAIDTLRARVFLQVWADNIESRPSGERVKVDDVRWSGNGRTERLTHLGLIQDGFEGFGVVCTSTEIGVISHFDDKNLLRFGELNTIRGRTYAEIDGRIDVIDIQRDRNNDSDLPGDLEEIMLQHSVDATTKNALISARIGQGKFRKEVLALWGQRCSITGSTIANAIRASHIKPWKESSNSERLDPFNGLPLIANFDALFDSGLISFDSAGKLLVLPSVNVEERRVFGLRNQSLRQKITAKTALYLSHHRHKHGFEK